MFNPGSAGYFVPTMPQAQRGFYPPIPQMRATPRWPQNPQIRPGSQPVAGKDLRNVYLLNKIICMKMDVFIFCFWLFLSIFVFNCFKNLTIVAIYRFIIF